MNLIPVDDNQILQQMRENLHASHDFMRMISAANGHRPAILNESQKVQYHLKEADKTLKKLLTFYKV